MQIVRITDRESSAYGILQGHEIAVCSGTPFTGLTPTAQTVPLATAQLLTPCLPGKMIAVWRNSRALLQSRSATSTVDLCYVLKPPSSFIGTGEPIRLPAAANNVIFEAELGIVIGTRCKAVTEADAARFVLGWTIVNEVTALDIVAREPTFPQYTRAKGFDTFGVFGPAIQTVFDPAAARIITYQNGVLRQNFGTSDLVRGPYRIVSELSHDMTLEPGDVVACGSSLGVEPMRAGDVIRIEIPEIGVLQNPVIEEPRTAM